MPNRLLIAKMFETVYRLNFSLAGVVAILH